MPRFDHIKGEVSVRNLVWRQGGKQVSPGGEVGTKSTPLHPTPRPNLQPHLDAKTKYCLFPKAQIPASGDWVDEGAQIREGRLQWSSP